MGEVILFSTIIFLLIIFFYKREKYIYVLMFFYLILPEYCAISIGSNLPTLTASRCLLILFILTTIIEKKKLKINILKETNSYKYFMLFFICETIVFLKHINITEHIKEYLGIILENFIFLLLLISHVDTKEKIDKFIKMLIFLATIVGIFSIFEVISGINLSSYLNTGANTSIMNIAYERLNIIRATFSLGHPICLAIFMGMLLPIVIYKINTSNKRHLKITLILTLLVIFLTISRGPIIIITVFLAYMFVFMSTKEKNKYLVLIFFSIMILILCLLISSNISDIFFGTVKSIFKEIGFEVNVDNFGGNTNGTDSRLRQWTALPKIIKQYPLCGGGSYYIFRNQVSYIRANGEISYLRSIDCEYLSLLINKGIIGFLGTIAFYIGILNISLKNPKSNLLKYLSYSYCIALASYITVCQLTTFKMFWTIIALIIIEKSLILRKEN